MSTVGATEEGVGVWAWTLTPTGEGCAIGTSVYFDVEKTVSKAHVFRLTLGLVEGDPVVDITRDVQYLPADLVLVCCNVKTMRMLILGRVGIEVCAGRVRIDF